jgi:hypothetical protein
MAMLKLVLVTSVTWSLVSISLFGMLGLLRYRRDRRAFGRTGAALLSPTWPE